MNSNIHGGLGIVSASNGRFATPNVSAFLQNACPAGIVVQAGVWNGDPADVVLNVRIGTEVNDVTQTGLAIRLNCPFCLPDQSAMLNAFVLKNTVDTVNISPPTTRFPVAVSGHSAFRATHQRDVLAQVDVLVVSVASDRPLTDGGSGKSDANQGQNEHQQLHVVSKTSSVFIYLRWPFFFWFIC